MISRFRSAFTRVRRLLGRSDAVFELGSTMVGVCTVGMLAAGVLVALEVVVPWAEDSQAKLTLSSVSSAQDAAFSKDEGFRDLDGLVEAGYLTRLTDGVAAEPDGTGNCFMNLARSGTGRIYYNTHQDPEPRLLTPTTTAPPGETALPCLAGGQIGEMVDEVGGWGPEAFEPIGSGEGTAEDPGEAVPVPADDVPDAPVVDAPADDSDVSAGGVTVDGETIDVELDNGGGGPATVPYEAQVTCYDRLRGTGVATQETVSGYFELTDAGVQSVSLAACSPGTDAIAVTVVVATDGEDVVWKWRSPVVHPQVDWVSSGLTPAFNGQWCIDNAGDADVPGNPVRASECADEKGQRWKWSGSGEVRQASLNHKCLNTQSGKLVLNDCVDHLGESFTAVPFEGEGTSGVLVQIVHSSGLCVDVPDDGIQLVLAPCDTSPTQAWHLPGADDLLDNLDPLNPGKGKD